MKSQKRFVVVFLIALGLQSIFAGEFYSNRLLVALKPHESSWITGAVVKNRGKISPDLNNLFRKYRVVRLERWLKSADENDVYNGIDFTKVYRLYLQKSSLLNAAKNEFAALPSVQKATAEPKVKIAMPLPATVPFDPYYNRQWYLKRIMANYAWTLLDQVKNDTTTVLIGIVDTGIDYLHPELEQMLYVNPGEDIDGDGVMTESDFNGIDDDNNGFVDDISGWDFSAASDSLMGDNDIRPPNAGANEILSHGTHVSGIAGAMPDNGIGISGIARHYKIIGTKHSLDDDVVNGYLYNAYDGILYCAKLGATVINCSWGGTYYSSLAQDLINMVSEKYGSIVVAAAGNDNTNNDVNHFYPSDLDGVITVAALSSGDRKASFSNFGRVIDISAPGQGIYSTIHYYKGGYASWQGTSMASPVVAGSFALLKYFFPNFTREELIDRLLKAADPLDSLNPGYAGLLGSGRVNVYNAIAPHFLPGIFVSNDSVLFSDDNENRQIDPGETVNISLTVANRANWQNAGDVKIAARCDDPLVQLTDSVVFFGDLPAGEARTNAFEDLELRIAPTHSYGNVKIEFTISAKTNSGQTIKENYSVDLPLSTYQKGFPWRGAGSYLPLSAVKSKNSSKTSIVFISKNNDLFLLNAGAETAENFPIDLGEFHRVPPVIADLDGDGLEEIITLSYRGKLKVISLDGRILWEKDLSETIYGTFCAADIDKDGQKEIIMGTMGKMLHVISSDGNEKTGFPLKLGALAEKGVAVADVTGDGLREIVLGTFDRKLHCFDAQGSELPDFPVELSARVSATPLIGRDANGIHLFVISGKKRVQIFTPTAETELDTVLNALINSQPALADIDGDGLIEMIATGDDGVVRIFSPLNGIKEIKSLDENNKYDLPPLIPFSGKKTIISLLASTGIVSVFNSDGELLPNTPFRLADPLTAAPVITDLDGDGDMELLSAGNDLITVLDLPDSLNANKGWTTFLGNNQRTGFLEVKEPSSVQKKEKAIVPSEVVLKVAPNPFNSSAKIDIEISQPKADETVKVSIYNVQGKRITTLYHGRLKRSKFSLYWRGTNRNGSAVSSGIYFCVVSYQKNTTVKQIVLIK
ncbi:MAG: S8 family serine peptidase [Calditrichaeota bacterium]|nr:S8 family serine peptidase [Calditrichota bacterium]